MSDNPFHSLLVFISPSEMQTYIVLMFLAVVAGVIIDVLHKRSAQYFFENAQAAEKAARRSVSVSAVLQRVVDCDHLPGVDAEG